LSRCNNSFTPSVFLSFMAASILFRSFVNEILLLHELFSIFPVLRSLFKIFLLGRVFPFTFFGTKNLFLKVKKDFSFASITVLFVRSRIHSPFRLTARGELNDSITMLFSLKTHLFLNNNNHKHDARAPTNSPPNLNRLP